MKTTTLAMGTLIITSAIAAAAPAPKERADAASNWLPDSIYERETRP